MLHSKHVHVTNRHAEEGHSKPTSQHTTHSIRFDINKVLPQFTALAAAALTETRRRQQKGGGTLPATLLTLHAAAGLP